MVGSTKEERNPLTCGRSAGAGRVANADVPADPSGGRLEAVVIQRKERLPVEDELLHGLLFHGVSLKGETQKDSGSLYLSRCRRPALGS
jgi:hypothetical protein